MSILRGLQVTYPWKNFIDFEANTVHYRAPGRVNIIGEHTDYNDGYVLPTTTSACTDVTAKARDDRQVRLASRNLQDEKTFSLDDVTINDSPIWTDYARGVAVEIEAHGTTLCGADVTVNGNIPIGGGLSSSASFEVGIAVALLDVAGASLPEKKIAQICQLAEIRFAGVNCGIMDQLAIAGCERGKAMLIDCRTLDARHADIPDNARLLVVDSGVRHQLPDSDYNERATECAEAVRVLSSDNIGIGALRDVSIEMLESNKHELGDLLFRRARHIVTENQRVLDAFAALQAADLDALGELISQSHLSLRDDFEISCDPVDRLVEIADACPGTLGSRQIGGGFGGCVLCLTTDEHLDAAREQITVAYSQVSGADPWVHVVEPSDPAGPVTEQ
jgi:galactokinase